MSANPSLELGMPVLGWNRLRSSNSFDCWPSPWVAGTRKMLVSFAAHYCGAQSPAVDSHQYLVLAAITARQECQAQVTRRECGNRFYHDSVHAHGALIGSSLPCSGSAELSSTRPQSMGATNRLKRKRGFFYSGAGATLRWAACLHTR